MAFGAGERSVGRRHGRRQQKNHRGDQLSHIGHSIETKRPRLGWLLDGTKLDSEAPMATLTIKNIPDTVVRKLKAQAARHRRSLNSEVIDVLASAGQAVPIDVEAL